ncbi:hypothetical protein AAFN86_06530 [Roseomonas sp. CAU 1739]|uniref:hypothetical protein n=1 Tax=Roseomonas sp. CAU 1739 TaxID=3140364 RepID=UPI00325AF538
MGASTREPGIMGAPPIVHRAYSDGPALTPGLAEGEAATTAAISDGTPDGSVRAGFRTARIILGKEEHPDGRIRRHSPKGSLEQRIDHSFL